MARFFYEYQHWGTNWRGWLIIFIILCVPFFWERARRASVFYHQALNFFLVFFVGSMFDGTDVLFTGNWAMGTAMFLGFGVGYSILALRKESPRERTFGWVFLVFFGCLVAMIVFGPHRRRGDL